MPPLANTPASPAQPAWSAPQARSEQARRRYLRGLGRVCDNACALPQVATGGGPALDVDLKRVRKIADSVFVDLLWEDIERFWKRSAQAEFEDGAAPFSWHACDPGTAGQVAHDAVGVLTRGCLAALLEMFRRYPADVSRDALLTWFESARRLSQCFDRIGIWPLLADSIAASDDLQRGMKGMARFLDLQIGSEYRALLGEEPQAYDYLQFVHWVLTLESVEFHRFAGPDEPAQPGCSPQYARAVADLEHLPLAASIDADESASVMTLAMSLLGSPHSEQCDEPALEQLLFAVTCLVAADRPLKQGSPWFSWDRPYAFRPEAQLSAVTGLVQAALGCLAEELPRYAFSADIEDAITAAPAPAGRAVSSL